MILTGSTLEVPEKVALHGSGSEALASAQTAPVDAIEVLLIDHLLETLTGSLAGLHPWQPLAKGAAAIQAAALAHPQIHQAPAEPAVIVADHPAAPAFVSQPRASALIDSRII
jgi:hypothetical protein